MRSILGISDLKTVTTIVCATICLLGCETSLQRLPPSIPEPPSSSSSTPAEGPSEIVLPQTTMPTTLEAAPHHKLYQSVTMKHNKSAQTKSPLPTNYASSNQKAKGSAAYYIPTTMVEDITYDVHLWIGGSVSLSQLREQLREYLLKDAKRIEEKFGYVEDKDIKGDSQIVGREIRIGKTMTAELRGTETDFTITPAGKITYAYTGEIIPWSWHVVPLRPSKNPHDLLPLQIIVESSDGLPPENEINERVMVKAIKLSIYERIKKAFEELDWWIKILGGSGIGAFVLWMYKKATRIS